MVVVDDDDVVCVGQCVSFQHEVCAFFATTKKYWDRIEQITQTNAQNSKIIQILRKKFNFFSICAFVHLGKNEFS